MPLLIIVRAQIYKNWRKRTADGWAAKQDTEANATAPDSAGAGGRHGAHPIGTGTLRPHGATGGSLELRAPPPHKPAELKFSFLATVSAMSTACAVRRVRQVY